MAFEFYNDGTHKCVGFYDLVVGKSGIQANQFLIVHGMHSALLDPGGELTYNELYVQSYRYLFTKNLEYVIASHQDPDVITSLDKWLVGTHCKIVVAEIWKKFILHIAPAGSMDGRIITIPDRGMNIRLGDAVLQALPAHFLHSEGNFQFYDPQAKILFSGDLGSSIIEGKDISGPVTDFESHIPAMIGFHQRYMNSNKICRYWVRMVRQLDLEWIIPQHGPPFKGRQVIGQFLDWVEQLECGIDLMTQDNYRVPTDDFVDSAVSA